MLRKVIDFEYVKETVSGEHDIDLTDGQAMAIAVAAGAKVGHYTSIQEAIDDALFATQDLYVSCGDCGSETDEVTREGVCCTVCNRGVFRLRIVRDDSKDICSSCGTARSEHPVKLASGTFGVDGHRFFIHWSEITTAWAARHAARRAR